jgi:hypothetical protein
VTGICISLIILVGIFAPATLSATSSLAYIDERGYSENGNQEMLFDPVRSLVYFSDPVGDSVWIWDGHSDLAGTAIVVGRNPLSLALAENGTQLLVSISQENAIKVIDIGTRSVVRTINLSFAPRSVQAGPEGRLCVSGAAGDTIVRMVNATTGEVVAFFNADGNTVLNTSPDGRTLLAATLGTSPTLISKYNLTGDAMFKVRDGEFGELDGNMRQMVADWVHGVIYMTQLGGHFVGLGIEDLRLFKSFPTDSRPTSLALSSDGKTIAAWSGSFSSTLEVYNVDSMLKLGSIVLESEAGTMVFDSVGMRFFLGSPEPTVMPITCGTLTPTVPWVGRSLGYTPAYVEIAYVPGDLNLYPETIDITLNDVPCATEVFHDYTTAVFKGRVQNSMPDGTVTVNATMQASGYILHSSYEFRIDHESPEVRMPTMSFHPQPIANGVPFGINVTVFDARPEPLGATFSLKIDGTPIQVERNEWPLTAVNVNVTYMAMVTSIAPGAHNAEAIFSFEGTDLRETLSFGVAEYGSRSPSLSASAPLQGEWMTHPPASITVAIDHGDPYQPLQAIDFTLDGMALSDLSIGPDAVTAQVHSPVVDGHHTIHVSANLGGVTYQAEWSFEISATAPPGFIIHSSEKGYSINMPETWTAREDVTVGGNHADTLITGPLSGGVQTNVVIISGTELGIQDTRAYLENQVQATLDGLAQQGLDGVITDQPVYKKISGRSAVVFGYDFNGNNMHQMAALIIDGPGKHYWTISLTESKDSRASFDDIFTDMVDSFTVTSAPAPINTDLTLLISAIVVAAIIVIAIVAFIVTQRRGPKAGAVAPPTPVKEQSPAAQTQLPIKDGASVQSGPVFNFCPTCGTKSGGTPFCPQCGRKMN